MRPAPLLIVTSSVFLLYVAHAAAAPPAGTILASDDFDGLYAVDPATGDRTVLSDAGMGGGPIVTRIVDAAFDHQDGSFVGADFDSDALLRIDTYTGSRTVVASPSVGSGGAFRPSGVAILVDGTILASDSTAETLYSVDPTNGDRTVISSSSVGTGLAFVGPGALALESSSSVWVSDLSRIVRVDLATGNRTIVSGLGVGSGPALALSTGLVRDADGSFLLNERQLDAVLRIDPVTGNRTVVSSALVGSGATFSNPEDVWPSPDGATIYVSDLLAQAIFAVDVATGDRTVLADASTGSGHILSSPRAFAVVPTPRLIRGFEGDTAGLPPTGVFSLGSTTVEDPATFFPAITAQEGALAVYMTTGPGSNGVGPDLDQTGDGNVESDRAEIVVLMDRGPNDPPLLSIDIAILTSEVSGGAADPISLGIGVTAPPFGFELSIASNNGTYQALPIPFVDGPYLGPDGSSFDDGWTDWVTFQGHFEVGTDFLYIDVGDEIDAIGDTALLVDNIRFLPEPTAPLQLLAGLALLAGLLRLRCRRASTRAGAKFP